MAAVGKAVVGTRGSLVELRREIIPFRSYSHLTHMYMYTYKSTAKLDFSAGASSITR